MDQVKSILSRFCYINVKAPRFFGGMVGYFAYDCVYSLFEKVRNVQINNPGSAGVLEYRDRAARFMLTKDCIVFDHAERKLYIFSSPFLTYDADLKSEYQKSFAKILALRDHIATLASEKRTGAGQKQEKRNRKVNYIPSISQDAFERSGSPAAIAEGTTR